MGNDNKDLLVEHFVPDVRVQSVELAHGDLMELDRIPVEPPLPKSPHPGGL